MVNNKTEKPNILFITADQFRYDCTGFNGNKIIQTPNLDSLAEESFIFDNAFVQNPACSPSRCSMLTGLYPHNHKLITNPYEVGEHLPYFPLILRDAGYATVAIGKMHFGSSRNGTLSSIYQKQDFGFDYLKITESKRGEKNGFYAEHLEQKGLTIIKDQQEIRDGWAIAKTLLDEEDYVDTVIGQHSCEYLKQAVKQDKPFFLWASFISPHPAFDPPEPYASMYNPEDMPDSFVKEGELDEKPPMHKLFRDATLGGKRKPNSEIPPHLLKKMKAYYYGMITLVDKQIGNMIDILKKSGKYENTLIIFTADHGDFLGDHGLLTKGKFLYDCIVKVPMILKAPGQKERRRFSDMVEAIDLPTTFIKAAGAEVPIEMQGMDLADLVNNRRTWREFAFSEAVDLKMIRNKKWKLVYYQACALGELYDLENDPMELTNLYAIPEFKEIKESLIHKLFDYMIHSTNWPKTESMPWDWTLCSTLGNQF